MCSAPTTIQSSKSSSGVILPTQMAEGGPRNRNGHHIADCSDNELESSPVMIEPFLLHTSTFYVGWVVYLMKTVEMAYVKHCNLIVIRYRL